jgi:two-component system chemotaxis response regulator CheB
MRPVRLAIVDDSSFIREALTRLLQDEPRIDVVGVSPSGEHLMRNISNWRPEVITLDLEMPGIGGMATIDQIMAKRPTPIIILSSHSSSAAELTIEALSRGAADFIDKQAYSLVDFAALRRVLVRMILELAGHGGNAPVASNSRPIAVSSRLSADEWRALPEAEAGSFELILIGASTGGPEAIQRVLQDLGDETSAPIVIAQHMATGFSQAFAERLDRLLPLTVREISDSVPLGPGTVGIAKAGGQVVLNRRNGQLVAKYVDDAGGEIYRPSIDGLFQSAAQLNPSHTIAILLTGMGSDGAAGMTTLARGGAHTIAQDEETSLIYGMPKAAVRLNAAREVVAIGDIGRKVRALLRDGVQSSVV